MTSIQSAERFHRSDGVDECVCPIHRRRERDPFTAPLGLPFASNVWVDEISRERASDVYAAHHSYMTDVPSVNLVHHGPHYRRSLVGAITYRYPLLSRKRLHLDHDGRPIPPPRPREDIIDELPEALHNTAIDCLGLQAIDESDVAESTVLQGDSFVEAARICIGVRMPNLASATLARSQETFVAGPNCDRSVEYLLTFVRADFDAAMIRALRDKGWTCVGWSGPTTPGNRDVRPIHKRIKWTFLCPVDRDDPHESLARWST